MKDLIKKLEQSIENLKENQGFSSLYKIRKEMQEHPLDIPIKWQCL